MSNNQHDTHLKQAVAKFFIRSNRGDTLLNRGIDPVRDVLDGTLYMFSIHWVSGVAITFELLCACVLIKKIVGYLIGWWDEINGFYKYENEYVARKINPFYKELLARIVNIERMCEKHDKKD